MIFTSDNVAPAHPAILDALERASRAPAFAYGADEITARVEARLSALFERELRMHPVATGTAANALALACLCPPWAAIYCHAHAHIEEDECGAPEFFTGGAKLTLLQGDHARIAPDSLRAALAGAAHAGVHNIQPGAVSLTQSTEHGAVYSAAQIAALTEVARDYGLPVHMDGARFANALAALGCAPADITWRAGVDALSMGFTKTGAMAAEAVLLFDAERSWECELRRKRGGHLWSKMRYLSAQIEALLENDLWLRLASHANAMARSLAEGVAVAGGEILHPVEANAVFARLPTATHTRLEAAGARYYPWPDAGDTAEASTCRLVCSWATEAREVERFLDVLARS